MTGDGGKKAEDEDNEEESASLKRTIKRKKKVGSGAKKKRRFKKKVAEEDDDASVAAGALSGADGEGGGAAPQDLFVQQETSRVAEADGDSMPDMRTEADLEKARSAKKWAQVRREENPDVLPLHTIRANPSHSLTRTSPSHIFDSRPVRRYSRRKRRRGRRKRSIALSFRP